ncbi:MAG: hypothetical protein VCB78_01400 [Myxococcota bacterium]
MSRAAHPDAMSPAEPGRTRTAPPQKPASWPSHPRMRVYTLFGWTGVLYLLIGFGLLETAWSLGQGEVVWDAKLASFSHPAYVAFHLLCLVSVVFVAVRFFRLFPKSQPARIGPAKPPPRPVILAGLYAAWLGVTALFVAILSGAIFS